MNGQYRFRVWAGALAAGSAWVLLLSGGCPAPGGGNNNNNNDNAAANENANANANGNANENAAATFPTPTRSSSIALTSDDRHALLVNPDNNTLSIVQVRDANGADTADWIAEVSVGVEPHSVAISPDNREAYVSNSVSGTVSVVALTGTQAFTVVAEIPVGTEPRGLALTPNGRRIFVANHTAGTVTAIESSTRAVLGSVNVGGDPAGIAITNDLDTDDADETVFVTQFRAELIPGGPGENFDTGKQGVVHAFPSGNLAAAPTKITVSPLADAGFTGDRSKFCQLITAGAANNTFCPDINIADATNDVIDSDPQGAYPNQLEGILIRGERLYLPNIGVAPEPPIKFNINVQALVSVIDTDTLSEIPASHVNLNAQIKLETQPAEDVANTVLTRLFGGDMVACDASPDASAFLFVSRGGNYVMRATRNSAGAIDIGAPNVIRFQTGNLPTGVVVSNDGKRAYTNNELSASVTAINLENNTVIEQDIVAGDLPAPGTFDHGVRVGKLVFFTSLGVADNGIFSQPLREIVPREFRNKASDNSWSSCASCHPNGHADGATWTFATGPRQTVSLDAFFAKDNPHDQKISNWSAVRGGVNDFNENSVVVQGGKGFAGTPPNPNIYNHGITQGASDALDAQNLWVQTIRAPILPAASDEAAAGRGRELFGTNCASCHGGPKWTKSQILHLDNPVFTAPPVAGSVPRDPGLLNAAAQLRQYTVGANTIVYMESVGTFSAASPIEIRADGTAALGGLGFNVPSLLGIAYHAPYFHDGSAQSLEEVFARHLLGASTIAATLSATDQADLLAFVRTIDGATETFRSAADDFRDAISP